MKVLMVDGLTVEGLRVEGLRVEGLRAEGLGVEGLRVEGWKRTRDMADACLPALVSFRRDLNAAATCNQSET